MLRFARSLQNVSVLQRFYSSLHSDKIYELRTYKIWPQHVKEFLSLTNEEFHLRTAHSKLTGYWTSELGGINQVVHIWEYDNLEHRASVRATLASSDEWIQRYFSKILPLMSCQENSTMKLLPSLSLREPQQKGVYNLQTLQLEGSANQWEHRLKKTCESIGQSSVLIGAFKTVHGNGNEAVLLWQHPSLSDSVIHQELLEKAADSTLGPLLRSVFSKILIPHKVSPLQ